MFIGKYNPDSLQSLGQLIRFFFPKSGHECNQSLSLLLPPLQYLKARDGKRKSFFRSINYSQRVLQMLDTQIRQRHAVFTLVELTLFRPQTVLCFSSHLPGREQALHCLRPVSMHSASFSSLALTIHFHEELLYLLRCSE